MKKIIYYFKNNLFKNIICLFGLRGLEYLLSLILIPYLVRVLDVAHYGEIVFVQSVLQYFIVVNNYGFNYSATRSIVLAENNTIRFRVFSTVTASKLILFAFLTTLFILLIQSGYFFKGEKIIYLFSYLAVLGNALFPIWFFQGTEKMWFITISMTIARFISIIFIVIFVKNTQDYVLAAFFQSIPVLIAALISYVIIYKQYGNIFNKPTFSEIKHCFMDGWNLFLSGISSNLYTTSNVVILGVFTNNTLVGYYSGAEKIIRSIVGLYSPFSQALYPYITGMISKSESKAKTFVCVILKYGIGIGSVTSFLLLYFGDKVVILILAENFFNSIILLKIMSPLILILLLSNILGALILIPFKQSKFFKNILICAAVIDISIIIPLVSLYGAIGAAIASLLVESFIVVTMLWYVKKNILIKS